MRIHKLLFTYNYSSRIQTFLWKNWVCIRGLESLGTDESRYGKIQTPMIYNKPPTEVRKNIILQTKEITTKILTRWEEQLRANFALKMMAMLAYPRPS